MNGSPASGPSAGVLPRSVVDGIGTGSPVVKSMTDVERYPLAGGLRAEHADALSLPCLVVTTVPASGAPSGHASFVTHCWREADGRFAWQDVYHDAADLAAALDWARRYADANGIATIYAEENAEGGFRAVL